MQDDIDKTDYGAPHKYIFTTLSRNDRKCGEPYVPVYMAKKKEYLVQTLFKMAAVFAFTLRSVLPRQSTNADSKIWGYKRF